MSKKTFRFQIEEIDQNHGCEFDSKLAKELVKRRRNIFSDSTRRYIVNDFPPVIKEIDRFKDEVRYWYWVFFPGKIYIFKFDRKPTRREIREVFKRILKISEEYYGKVLH